MVSQRWDIVPGQLLLVGNAIDSADTQTAFEPSFLFELTYANPFFSGLGDFLTFWGAFPRALVGPHNPWGVDWGPYGGAIEYTFVPTSRVPEPDTLALMALGLLGLIVAIRSGPLGLPAIACVSGANPCAVRDYRNPRPTVHRMPAKHAPERRTAMRAKMRTLFLAVAALGALGLVACSGGGGENQSSGALAATISWSVPQFNTDGSSLTDVTGYRVYWNESREFGQFDPGDRRGRDQHRHQRLGTGHLLFRCRHAELCRCRRQPLGIGVQDLSLKDLCAVNSAFLAHAAVRRTPRLL